MWLWLPGPGPPFPPLRGMGLQLAATPSFCNPQPSLPLLWLLSCWPPFSPPAPYLLSTFAPVTFLSSGSRKPLAKGIT